MIFRRKSEEQGDTEKSGITVESVLHALRDVKDPEIGRPLVELGMIRNVRVCGGHVALEVQLTTPACPLKATIEQDCRNAVMSLPGVEQVNIDWSSRVPQARRREQQPVPGVKHIVAVASGKGGVGKSTVAVNLAAALASSGAKTGLLDADIYGPSIPLMLDIRQTPMLVKVRDPETGEEVKRMAAPEKYGLKLMSLGFLAEGDAPVMWRGPMVASAVRQMLTETDWGELDYLVVDLPPGTGDAQISLAQIVPLTGVVIVMTPQDVALTIATKALRMFEHLNTPVLGIVENMATFVCPNCGEETDIFGHTGAGQRAAEEMGVRFLGRIPLDARIVTDSDAGVPTFIRDPGSRPAQAYASIASQVAAEISVQTLTGARPPREPADAASGPR